MAEHDFVNDRRFAGLHPFEKKIWLSSPTMHGEENEEKQIPPASYSKDEEWVQEYIRQFGEEPGFF